MAGVVLALRTSITWEGLPMKLKQKALLGVALLLTAGTTLAGCGKEGTDYKYIPGKRATRYKAPTI